MFPAIQELYRVIRTYYTPREDDRQLGTSNPCWMKYREDHTDAVVHAPPQTRHYRASCPATLFDLETKFMRDMDKATREELTRRLRLYRFDEPTIITIHIDDCTYVFELVPSTKEKKEPEMR
jgi:hypothetical protein